MPIQPVPIDAAPPVPSSGDPEETFDPTYETHLTWQGEKLRPQANALAQVTYENTIEAVQARSDALSARDQAAESADAAADDAARLAALDALWLGAAAADPATGRGGMPLVAGNAYVNSVSGLLRAFNGAAWGNALNVVAGVESVNGQVGAVTFKTVGGQSLTGVGDLSLTTVPAITPAALDIDCSAGVYFTKTIAANSTFTFSNPPASGTAYAFALEVNHTSGTIAWPAAVRWADNTAPTLTTGRTHLFVFTTDDGGARWRAAVNPNYTT